MVLDVSALPDSEEEEEDDEVDELRLDLDQANDKRKGLGRLHISHLLQMVLQDAQTRLFFKAQSIIQSDIRYYTARQEDIAYPDKLLGWFAVRVPWTVLTRPQMRENPVPARISERRRA